MLDATISTKQLAKILGISVQRVNELGRKGKISRESDGGWNLVKVNADLRKNLNKSQVIRSLGQKAQSESAAVESGEGESFSEAQRRLEWAKVQKAELELRKRGGELLERADVELTWTTAYTGFDNLMRLIPDKLAPRIAVLTDVLEIRMLIEQEIEAALHALSEIEDAA